MPNDRIFDPNQVTKNKRDPLKDRENREGARRELFERYSGVSSGFEHRDVVYAAGNLILNAIRQQCKTRDQAEKVFDEFVANLKRNLIDYHYFPSGNRRSVFPYDQNIEAVLVNAKAKCIPPSG